MKVTQPMGGTAIQLGTECTTSTFPLNKLNSCTPFRSEFEKTIVFHGCFLENAENFLNFAKSSKKIGKFLNYLEFSKFIVNSLILLNFLDFSRML